MNSRVRHLIAPLAVLAVLAFVPQAGASPTGVIRACLNEQLLDGFSDADKRAALDQLAADQDEYSDCRAVIGAAIGGGAKVIAGASSNGSPGAGTPTERREQRRAAARKRQQVRETSRLRARKVRERELGKRAVDPQDAGVLKSAGTANGMPLSVVLAVIVLGLAALTGGLLTLSRRNPRVGGALGRVSPPRFRR